MATKNYHLQQLTGRKTYMEIIEKVWQRVDKYRIAHPQQKIFMMSLGDTTQPLPSTVVQAMVDATQRLGNPATYTGYGDFVGDPDLRQTIAANYYRQGLGIELDPGNIFISDGAQSASVTLQELFSVDNVAAIPNPMYPSFLEGTLMAGRPWVEMPCREEDNFVPQPPEQRVDIIYLCFPNNPTGVVADRGQLQTFVDYARNHRAVIIFDAVYSRFVTTPNVPRSIYEIPGAEECAIEIGSFSKIANFTGVRVGWSVIPHALTVQDTLAGELHDMWRVRYGIKFWGPANVAQQGAIAALSAAGQEECQAVVNYYLENASLLRCGMERCGFRCFGGFDNPYVWVKAPDGISSWQFFEDLLQSTGIVGVPGSVFGACGEGYLRLSALGQRQEICAAVESCTDSRGDL